MSLRILLADRQPVVHQGVVQILAGTEFQIVKSASDNGTAMDSLQIDDINLLITDFQLSDGDCFKTMQLSKELRVPVLVFSGYDNPMFVSRAIEAGAFGLVSKSSPPQDLIETLRKVSAGKRTWRRRDLRRVTGALATDRLECDIDLPLTNREFQILLGVTRGLTNKRIADELTISYETVKEHVQHILRKLGVTDRTQAAVWAVRKGII